MLTQIKSVLKAGLAAAVLATSFIALPASAQAQSGVAADGSYQVADHRGNWRGGNDWRRHGNRHYGNRYYGGRGYYYNDNNWGGAAAAGVLGLATGAIIANSMNQPRYDDAPRYYAGDDYIAYCSSRYRSFNPRTGTFTGYDGLQHRCVMR